MLVSRGLSRDTDYHQIGQRRKREAATSVAELVSSDPSFSLFSTSRAPTDTIVAPRLRLLSTHVSVGS